MAIDLKRRLARWLYASPAYAWVLSRSSPRQIDGITLPRAAGDPRRGRQIVGGTLLCADRSFDPDAPPWLEIGDHAALRELHGFGYLADLAALGDEGRRRAHDLVASWLSHAGRWREETWAPEVLGDRIQSWLSHIGFLAADGGDSLHDEMIKSLACQVRHLARVVTKGRPGLPRLASISGLISGVVCGLGGSSGLKRTLSLLRQEIGIQILEDGVHVTRSPTEQYGALTYLVDIRALLRAAKVAAPAELEAAITRMTPMLRFFRHRDGGLVQFNGSAVGHAAEIDALLARANIKGVAPYTASRAGFQRLAAGSTLVIQDAGPPPLPPFDVDAHAGALAFEMSDDRDRLIVNCGVAYGPARDALRATAAHSTLVVDDVNSAEILLGGGIGRRLELVETAREEVDGNVWVSAAHDGYRERFGLVHRRRLYLSAGGDNLRGEDTLIPSGSTEPAPHAFVVRFHLHPGVQASLIHSGAAILLRLPSGAGWRFQCSGGVPQLEESIYYGDGRVGRRTQQIAVSGATHRSGAVIKWAYQRASSV